MITYFLAVRPKRPLVWISSNTVQKVAGTLRVPSAEPQKALLFEGYGTWNVPTTLLHGTVFRLTVSRRRT